MLPFLKLKLRNLISDEKFSEILAGSVWALSGRVIGTALGLVFSVLVARLYGAEVVGIVAVINSFLMLASMLTLMGTQTSILRLLPEHLAKYSPTSAFKVYRKTQWMVIGLSVIMAIVFYFSAQLVADKVFSKPHFAYYFALASVFIVFQAMMQLNTSAVRGLCMIKLFAVMQFLPQACNLFFLIAVGLLWPVRDVPVYAALFGFTATGIISWFAMELAFKKKTTSQDTVHHMPGRTILSISLPMLLTSAMVFIIGETGVLMLGIYRTEAEVGYYAVAVKLATLTVFMLRAVNSMAGPKFSEYFHTNRMEDLFHVAKKSSKLIFFVTTPLLLFLLIFGKSVLGIIFGPEFITAYPALAILAVGQFVNSISGSTGIFMNMTGYQIIFRNIMIMTATMNIILNFWFIPYFGIIGAAFAATISLCCWNITTLLYMKYTFGKTTAYVPQYIFKKLAIKVREKK